jgi:hypothetical protein
LGESCDRSRRRRALRREPQRPRARRRRRCDVSWSTGGYGDAPTLGPRGAANTGLKHRERCGTTMDLYLPTARSFRCAGRSDQSRSCNTTALQLPDHESPITLPIIDPRHGVPGCDTRRREPLVSNGLTLDVTWCLASVADARGGRRLSERNRDRDQGRSSGLRLREPTGQVDPRGRLDR